jgi:lysozyme family protein
MADSKIAIAMTLIHEGGYVDNPADSGGPTNMGITQKDMPGQDMRTLKVEKANTYYQ